MPIRTSVPIRLFDQEAFHQVDKRVTGIAFDIHNEFGRFLEERLYQRELTRRCRASGLEVQPELEISVSLGDFNKYYLADHLINQGVIIELKAATALSPAHKGQTLNYLFLCGLHHATMLNFRTERVQHEFVSTRLTSAYRHRYEFVALDWEPLTSRCRELADIMDRVLTEWGAFLDPLLYRDALTFFLGGEERVVREIGVQSGDQLIGTQKVHLLTDDVAFSVTSSIHRPDLVREHQRRFLKHTSLRAMQWINLNHHQIEFRTIQ